MLRGNSPAKIDDRGRLKIPNGFRSFIEDEHGRELFVTSLHGDSVRLYPMAVWTDIEKKLAQIPSTHPSRLKFLDRVNFYGQVSEIDSQGRVVIPRACASRPRWSAKWMCSVSTTISRSGITSGSSRSCNASRLPTTTLGRCPIWVCKVAPWRYTSRS